MKAVDIINLCLSLLGIYSIIICPRYLLPRNVAPLFSTILDETHQLLSLAEEIGAIPLQSGYKRKIESSAYQFAMMRTTSNHSRGVFQQLHIALLGGLTCKLLSLYYQIEAIKSELELEIDKQQLNSTGSATTVVSGSVDSLGAFRSASAIPVDNIDAHALPLPVTEHGNANRVLLNDVLDLAPVIRVLRPIFAVFISFRTFVIAPIGALQDSPS